MLLSLNWLREFVPYEGTAQELGNRLTMLGFELEDIIRPYNNIQSIIVGKIIHCEKHPEADKLSICTIDIGQETLLHVLCGASNVAIGQKVPVATIGTTMPDGTIIKKIKLRGIESFGMICSEKELEFTDDHSGILVLPEELTVGTSLVNALNLDTEILKISITPNRGDCLSILGLAREVSAAFGLPLSPQQPIHFQEVEPDFSKNWSVHVSSKKLCSSYLLRLVENISVQKSPLHIRHRLHSMGIRPISNVVDITNYILLELGQPLHAFDKDLIEGNTTYISLAKEEEIFCTLDGKKHTLTPSDLIIYDDAKPIALAGIMGCQNSKVTETTKNILIESAVFNPSIIRKTTRRLGISTESSYRFERGVDSSGVMYALNKAIKMIIDTSGGEVKIGKAYYEPTPYKQPIIQLDTLNIQKVTGTSIPSNFCIDTLTQLGFEIDTSNCNIWDITIPSWRRDIQHSVDLIEEILRFYGLNTIPEELPCIYKSLNDIGLPESQYQFIKKVKHWACGVGLNETENYSFIGNHELDLLKLPNNTRLSIYNPLTEEQNVLRTSLIPSLLNNVKYNVAHGNTGLRLFEVANTYTFEAISETTAKEVLKLGIVMHGDLFDTGWPHPSTNASYLDLLGVVEHFITFLHLPRITTSQTDIYAFLNPGVDLFIHGKKIGYIGCISQNIAKNCHTHKEIWITELDLETLAHLYKNIKITFKPLPIYPSSYRDITLIISANTSISNIKSYMDLIDIPILESIFLLDIFKPNNIEQHCTFRFIFRSAKKTLKDSEIDLAYKKITELLSSQFNIKLNVLLE